MFQSFPPVASRIPNTQNELPTGPELAKKLRQAQALMTENAIEPATLYLWGILEAALRKRAIARNIPVERLPAAMLLNHMYSQGEISVMDIDLFREFMHKRNRIAHGSNESIDLELVSRTFSAINNLLPARVVGYIKAKCAIYLARVDGEKRRARIESGSIPRLDSAAREAKGKMVFHAIHPRRNF